MTSCNFSRMTVFLAYLHTHTCQFNYIINCVFCLVYFVSFESIIFPCDLIFWAVLVPPAGRALVFVQFQEYDLPDKIVDVCYIQTPSAVKLIKILPGKPYFWNTIVTVYFQWPTMDVDKYSDSMVNMEPFYILLFSDLFGEENCSKYVMISVENTKMTPSTTKKKKRPPQRRCGDWCEFLSSKVPRFTFLLCIWSFSVLNLAQGKLYYFQIKKGYTQWSKPESWDDNQVNHWKT